MGAKIPIREIVVIPAAPHEQHIVANLLELCAASNIARWIQSAF